MNLRKVIEAFEIPGYRIVKQPNSDIYVIYVGDSDEILATDSSLEEIQKKWNYRDKSGHKYTNAQIGKAKKLGLWELNYFDKYKGHITDWDRFREGNKK